MQDISGLERIRISSIEPNTVTDSLLKLISESKIICSHLHIPLQAASDTILKGMNRCYDTNKFQELMQRFREFLPDGALGTDIITGFPGETEDLFQEGLEFIGQQPFTYLHVFRFSPRDGTKAVCLKDPVSVLTAKKRSQVLQLVSDKLKSQDAQTFVGKNSEVLFEEQKEEGFYEGYTPEYLRVRVSSPKDLTNQIVAVKLSDFEGRYFEGSLK